MQLSQRRAVHFHLLNAWHRAFSQANNRSVLCLDCRQVILACLLEHACTADWPYINTQSNKSWHSNEENAYAHFSSFAAHIRLKPCYRTGHTLQAFSVSFTVHALKPGRSYEVCSACLHGKVIKTPANMCWAQLNVASLLKQ